MATTENAMTGLGDGTKDEFSFTFPYLKTTDLKVELVRTTTADSTTTKTILESAEFTFPTATSVKLSTFNETATDSNDVDRTTWQEYDTGNVKANGNGYTYSGKVYRSTASDSLAATFYPGSAIRSSDLNDNFTQNLYVTQEAENYAATAITDSATAITTADAAVETADDADATADTAKDTADDAQRATDRLVATTDDGGLTWTLAGTNTNDSTDPKGVGYAVAKAEAAVETADDAEAIALAAQTAVSNSTTWTQKPNKTDFEAITFIADTETTSYSAWEITDSTDINGSSQGEEEYTGFTDGGGTTKTVSLIPAAFVGDDGLSARFTYNHDDNEFTWAGYWVNDAEDRYMVGPDGAGTDGYFLQTDGAGEQTWAEVDLSAKADLAGADFTGDVSVTDGGVEIRGVTNGTNTKVLSTGYQWPAGTYLEKLVIRGDGGVETPGNIECSAIISDFINITDTGNAQRAFYSGSNTTWGAHLWDSAESGDDRWRAGFKWTGDLKAQSAEFKSDLDVSGEITAPTNTSTHTLGGTLEVGGPNGTDNGIIKLNIRPFNITCNSSGIEGSEAAGYTTYNTIIQSGSEDLFVNVGASTVFVVRGSVSSTQGNQGTEELARFTPGAGVELLYNNVKKLETTTDGVTITDGIDIDGPYTQVAEAVGALAIDCGTGNYFTKTIDGNSTFTVSSVPASKSYSFVLELTHTSGTITWFSGVEWPAATAPTLTTGKTHLFVFHTDNGGTRWRASSLVDYTT